MLSVDKYGMNLASFEFKFTTSDGDKIDLKLSDSLEASSSYVKKDGAVSEELTLKHQFSYEFSYEGNGLSKEDLKEIKEAFKKIKPMLEKFLKEKQSNDKIMNNFAHHLKSFLPEAKNENHLNAIKKEGVNTFDEVLKSIRASLEDLNNAKKLFDKLFDNSKKLEIFA
jgi:hypothetical protein